MKEKGESFAPNLDEDKDCPCGRYPDGDCHICLTEQGNRRYQENLKKSRNPESTDGEEKNTFGPGSDSWEEMKRKLYSKK